MNGMRMALAAMAATAAMAGAAVAADADGRGSGTITTSATARGRLPNTVADVSIGVEAHGPTLAGTQAALAAGNARLLDYLRQQGVERLRTEQLSVTPRTAADKNGPERIVGYDGRALASFRVPADRVGAVTAGGLGQGGNDLERTVLGAREAEVDAERARLGADAAKAALQQAAVVAEATGRRLGAVRHIEVLAAGEVGPRPLMRLSVAAAAPPPFATAAGDTEIATTVSVTAELVEPPP